jgi:uncharacterized protein YndB with AHSA1/START domain
MPVQSETTNEIAMTRVFDVPRELVFRMWSDPEHLAQWWGPKGFRNTIHKFDFRPGGEWNFTMHGPDGRDYANKIIYREIVRPERIAYSHVSGPLFEATATFEEEGTKTKLTMRAVFATPELRDRVAQEFGAVEGMQQTLARLDDLLANIASEELVITRQFNAPRDVVFRAFTSADQLAQWWGPKGWEMQTCKLDLRPGGRFHYGMRMADGQTMWGRFVFREIDPPRRLVWVNSFSDENGGLTKPPFPMPWPPEIVNHVTFEEHGGKTTVTLRSSPIHATEAERETFSNGHSSMQQGFGGTFDQLDAHLSRRSS